MNDSNAHNHSLVPKAAEHVSDRIELVVLAARLGRSMKKLPTRNEHGEPIRRHKIEKDEFVGKRSTAALERIGRGEFTRQELTDLAVDSLRQPRKTKVEADE